MGSTRTQATLDEKPLQNSPWGDDVLAPRHSFFFFVWGRGGQGERVPASRRASRVGNLLSAVCDPCSTTVGSSGALFGLMGGMIPYCIGKKKAFVVKRHFD